MKLVFSTGLGTSPQMQKIKLQRGMKKLCIAELETIHIVSSSKGGTTSLITL